ncbi:PREDICTED: protein SFI1 homolog isoform X2 [Haliaeetus leucocephalus]|uniref:protein SFI1 homolog isoform X2 n=1 Tax=Haliaeetus leucocephalus TaxID=52644 RepID=UPI00053CD77A|nr:PREDICTED: protein SFI1 homolog isoform X2 [Haliaeetus leucocephalus]
MEKSRSSSKSLKMHEIQQLPRHQMHATGQSVAPQSARHRVQDRGHDDLGQIGYTWHHRRRLKEFQIRYLARKFFHLWAKKTFGQVFPSKARCFYDQKILQKTFGEWKEWWTVCGERKLSLRAGSHYRHLLQNLIFKAWRAYVCQQQGKRNKYCVAESHAKKQKLLRTWRHWLVYVDVQRTKHGMQSVALAFRERSCLRISWAVWRRRHYQNSSGHKMNILALQHWAQSLQFRAWLQWRELYLYSQNDKQKETRAVTHHRHWELKRCMEAWLGYLNLHREKKLQNELAQEHHQRRIVRQCFSHWQLSWECRRRVHAHQKDIEKLAARIALWRVFAHWKHYVVLCVEETRQCELAEKHYKHHLLESKDSLLHMHKLGFKGLWQNVMNARLQQMRKNLSYRQHQVTVLQKFWNHWKSRLEHEEEQQQQALTSVAHAHYRRVLMKQVFDTWLLNACNQQEYRMGEERAVLHFERQLLRCCWRFWHRRTAACLEEQEGLVRARDHYSNLLLLKAFGLWKQNTQERKTERLKEMQALRFQYSKCLQQTWNKWKEYMGHQREKWRKLVQADMHYRHTLLCKTLAAWKSYQHNVQCVLYQVAEKEKQHTRLLLRQLLCTWRENTLALICEVKATTQADEHYRRAILSKVLLQWRYTALLQVRCRQQKVTAVMEARKRLDIVRLQTLFLHWKELTRESLMLRAQQQRAVQHHQQHLLQKYLVKWKEYHQQRVGKMLLQRQGDWLMTRRLCSASFSCWKTQLLRQRWEKRKTVQALWHWSLSLQRKVFDAWLTFAKGQQQKKDHIEEATGFYHTTLLREGVTPVLRDTAGTEQLQGQLQAQHQLKVTFKMPDVSLETRGHLAEEEPWPSKCSHLPFHLADGDSVLSDLNAIRRARLPPRRPDFLLESLESNELLGPPFTRSEAPFQQTSVKKRSARTGNLMLTPQMEESTCKCISQMGNTSHSYPSLIHAALPSVPLWTNDVHRAVQRPELWSPSSFMSQMKAGAEMRGQPVSGHKGAHSQDSQQDSVKKLQPNLQPHLLSPEDFVGKRSHQTAAEGEEREHSSREEVALQRKLEVELQHIQQQMQYYFSRKQELKSCQQQAQILQKWLEKSMQPEAQDSVQGVQEELDQLQVRINTLSKAQVKERHHVQNLVARLHDIRIALDI